MKRVAVHIELANGTITSFWLEARHITNESIGWYAFGLLIGQAEHWGAVALWCDP